MGDGDVRIWRPDMLLKHRDEVIWTSRQIAAHYRALGLPVPEGIDTKKINKYNARKKEVDGIIFDSGREAAAYIKLRALQAAGDIVDIQRQVKFELVPPTEDERGVFYRADFVVTWKDGHKSVIEPKGVCTTAWIIKRKMFRQRYPELPLEEW